MNKYIATVRIKGMSIRTAVFAESQMHARLILEYQFGINSISSSLTQVTGEDHSYRTIEEVLASLKPKSPEDLTIDTLKNQKDQADKRLKAARAKKQLTKAQNKIFNLSR
jgi:hypothetical protein